MDSLLAADPVARHVIEQFSNLERIAGIRAHYKVMEPPPLLSTDIGSLQTAARVIADGVGLRNALFHIAEGSGTHVPVLMRTDRDQDEFTMELPSSAMTTVSAVLAALARQIARAYLINSNIAGSSSVPDNTTGSIADITAVFLGLGGLLLNDPKAGVVPATKKNPTVADEPLEPKYIAFAHRIACSMRGLDWQQHVVGLNNQAMTYLREWDLYRDSVFSLSLRNVLTASASHRPLQDTIDDNHLALARLDQFQKMFYASFLEPMQAQLGAYHEECLKGIAQLTSKEPDTYDPCMVYLNQVRRRMNLQRYTDELNAQQDKIFEQLEVLARVYSDMAKRKVLAIGVNSPVLETAVCPLDGTLIPLNPNQKNIKVKCPSCGYGFVAHSTVPNIPINLPDPEPNTKNSPTEPDSSGENSEQSESASTVNQKTSGKGWFNLALFGVILLPLSWSGLIGYAGYCAVKQTAPVPNLVDLLGLIGICGTAIGFIIALLGFSMHILKRVAKKDV